MNKCMVILLPGCSVQSCRLSSCEAFVLLERLPTLWSGRTTACIAAVGSMRHAAPLQVVIRSSGYARIIGALPVHGCSRAAPAVWVDLHLTSALVTEQPLLHWCGLDTPQAQ